MAFDLPGDTAERSLKRFSAESGLDVLFGTDIAADVKTNPVKGYFTPKEAIDLMLAGKRLTATQDTKTGAMKISRLPNPSVQKAPAPGAKSARKPEAPRTAGWLQPAEAKKKSVEADRAVSMEKLVVTGSNIPGAADATDVPVAVLGSRDILGTGVTNMMEVLRKRTPAFFGKTNLGNGNATSNSINTAGGSEVALRDLDTLVLINGRRSSSSGADALANGRDFVDVNLIPAAAIERVEVLTDGASAIYGSDAIGGVVNFILKSDYQGLEVGGRYATAWSGGGHYSERSGYVLAGAGAKGFNVMVSGNWSKVSPLFESDRNLLNPNLRTGTNFPGYVSGNFLNPNLNSPSQTNPTGTKAAAGSLADLVANGTYLAKGSSSIPLFDAAPFISLLLKQELKSATANASAELIGKKLVVFGDYLGGSSASFTQNSTVFGNLVIPGSTISGIATATVPAGSPYNPLNTAVAGVVVGSTLERPLQIFTDAKISRGTIGFRGDINPDWNWEVGYVNSRNTIEQHIKNEVFVPNLNAAIAGGYDSAGNPVAGGAYSKVLSGYSTSGPLVLQPALDPFARAGANPASLANVYGTEVAQTFATLVSYDAKIVGMPFVLPAGKAAFAFGAATRNETLGATPDSNSAPLSTDPARHNWAPGTFFDAFSVSRKIDALFAEIRVPITGPTWNMRGAHLLELSLAGRNEKYSDAGSSSVPKIGLRWQPMDEQLTVRFTYSKAFTAPTLSEEFGPPSAAAQTDDLLFTALPQYNDSRLKGKTYFSGNGNNPALQPTTAISNSAGIVFSPRAVKGLTLTLEYVNVFEKGVPSGLGLVTSVQSVNALGSASPYFNNIAIGNIPGQPGSSQALISSPGGLYNYLVSPEYANNLYLLDHFVNFGATREEMVDFDLEYEVRTKSMGKFTFGTTGTELYSFATKKFPTDPFFELAGYDGNNAGYAGGTLPKWTLYSTLEWQSHSWDALIANSYHSSTIDYGPPFTTSTQYIQSLNGAAPAREGYYVSWDAQLSYTVDRAAATKLGRYLKGMRFTIGVNNVFNRMPPYAPLAFPSSNLNSVNADVQAHSVIGRLVFASADLKF